MRKLLPVLVLLALGAAPAGAAGLLVNLHLLGSSPVGSFNDQFGSVNASDVFDTGGGFGGGIGFGLSENLFVGGEVDFYRNSGSAFDLDFGSVDYDLNSIPLLGTLEYVSGGGAGGIGFDLKGGAGVTFHSLSFNLSGIGDQSQSNFGFMLGGDLSYGLSENWALTAGLDFHETITGADCSTLGDTEGPFCDNDNPKFLLFTFGARYQGQ